MSTFLLCMLCTWVGVCFGFVFAGLLMSRSTPKQTRKDPGLPHHRKLDPVTKQALAEVFWLRADRRD